MNVLYHDRVIHFYIVLYRHKLYNIFNLQVTTLARDKLNSCNQIKESKTKK